MKIILPCDLAVDEMMLANITEDEVYGMADSVQYALRSVVRLAEERKDYAIKSLLGMADASPQDIRDVLITARLATLTHEALLSIKHNVTFEYDGNSDKI